MAEPTTRAERIDELYPWLLHWSIADERLGGFRSDAYAVDTPEGLVVVDALPLLPRLEERLTGAVALVLTHGNHQRSAWRLRRELGARVFVPVGDWDLDEEPDERYEPGATLPGGLRAHEASSFEVACFLSHAPASGPAAVFCGDLICQDPGGPYRFPDQPGYFDPALGIADARRLLALDAAALCPAHADPTAEGCRAALEGAVARADA